MESNHETTVPDGFYKDPNGMIIRKQCSCGRKNEQLDGCSCQKDLDKPIGMTGWICPVCGRGNSPFNSSCQCVSFPLFPGKDITFGQNQSSNNKQ